MSDSNGTYTIASSPPSREPLQKRSRWAELFTECRSHPNEWRRMLEPMKKSTASQMSSDIRNAHHRDPNVARLKGILPADRWETVWGNDPDDSDTSHFYVWLRYVGPPVRVSKGSNTAVPAPVTPERKTPSATASRTPAPVPKSPAQQAAPRRRRTRGGQPI